ncbi:hypothetical protein D3C72_1395590 [compost metagenome]
MHSGPGRRTICRLCAGRRWRRTDTPLPRLDAFARCGHEQQHAPGRVAGGAGRREHDRHPSGPGPSDPADHQRPRGHGPGRQRPMERTGQPPGRGVAVAQRAENLQHGLARHFRCRAPGQRSALAVRDRRWPPDLDVTGAKSRRPDPLGPRHRGSHWCRARGRDYELHLCDP